MKHPAYHLRPNKAIDRVLFLKLLEIYGGNFSIDKFTYYGFGGPFLDDIRLLQTSFPKLRCVSVEKNIATHTRQLFHRNSKNVRFVKNDVNSYLKQDFETGCQAIFWLDYTDFSLSRLDEFLEVLQKVGTGSIVKLTVRANADDFSSQGAINFLSDEMAALAANAAKDRFQREFDAYIDGQIDESDLSHPNIVETIQSIIRAGAQKSLPIHGGTTFQLIHSCRYADGVQMLSLTGVVCEASEKSNTVDLFKGWEFTNSDWHKPDHIDVPDLSVKERLALEKHLPISNGTGKSLQRALGYKIDGSDERSIRKLQQYQKFYSYYPMFAKMSV